MKQRYEKNPERWLNNAAKWQKAHPARVGQRNKRQRQKTQVKIADNLRSRIYQEILQKYKREYKRTWSTIEMLGCPAIEARLYIEQQFRDGMTWDNWGKVWQLDHIKPLAEFDLTSVEQSRQACNFRNLQPLLIEEHKMKSADDLRRILKKRRLV